MVSRRMCVLTVRSADEARVKSRKTSVLVRRTAQELRTGRPTGLSADLCWATRRGASAEPLTLRDCALFVAVLSECCRYSFSR
jgi:hypothetical protein